MGNFFGFAGLAAPLLGVGTDFKAGLCRLGIFLETATFLTTFLGVAFFLAVLGAAALVVFFLEIFLEGAVLVDVFLVTPPFFGGAFLAAFLATFFFGGAFLVARFVAALFAGLFFFAAFFAINQYRFVECFVLRRSPGIKAHTFSDY